MNLAQQPQSDIELSHPNNNVKLLQLVQTQHILN